MNNKFNYNKILKIIISIGLVCFFLSILPMCMTFIFDAHEVKSNKKVNITSNSKIEKVNIPKSIKVYCEKSDEVTTVPFEEYIKCVVASEMPNTFEAEAIKAQSVAARTYALGKIAKYEEKHPESHPDAPICDSTHCQAYHSKQELLDTHEDGWEETGWKKISDAVDATKGQAMYYDGKLVMQALFFSSSGGQTENSQDVFAGSYPYLVSVDSPYETDATHQNEKATFTLEEFTSKLEECYPDKNFGEISPENIKILEHSTGGRVSKIQIGNEILTGIEVRTALDLRSALFSIKIDGENIIFTTNGSGHGVGMSQYGANGMAKQGYTYDKILKHYYSGIEIA